MRRNKTLLSFVILSFILLLGKKNFHSLLKCFLSYKNIQHFVWIFAMSLKILFDLSANMRQCRCIKGKIKLYKTLSRLHTSRTSICFRNFPMRFINESEAILVFVVCEWSLTVNIRSKQNICKNKNKKHINISKNDLDGIIQVLLA